jgi:hypothetical protein
VSGQLYPRNITLGTYWIKVWVGTEDEFGRMRESMIAEWRKQQVEELHDLYHSLNIIRFIMSGSERRRVCSTYGGDDVRVESVICWEYHYGREITLKN